MGLFDFLKKRKSKEQKKLAMPAIPDANFLGDFLMT